MEHLPFEMIVRYANGHCTDAQRAAADVHFSECQECRMYREPLLAVKVDSDVRKQYRRIIDRLLAPDENGLCTVPADCIFDNEDDILASNALNKPARQLIYRKQDIEISFRIEFVKLGRIKVVGQVSSTLTKSIFHDALVKLESRDKDVCFQTSTSAGGEFSFVDLPKDMYRVFVDLPQRQMRVRCGYNEPGEVLPSVVLSYKIDMIHESGRKGRAWLTCRSRWLKSSDGTVEEGEIEFSSVDLHISKKGLGFFDALLQVRSELEPLGWRLVCYGGSLNVWPTPRQASEGCGLNAFKRQPGQGLVEIVEIFHTGPDVVPASIDEQRAYTELCDPEIR
jgi:hypothetical protein